MLFLRAKVIPVNPQIHGNVMCPSVCAVCTYTRYNCFLEISSRYIHSLIKYVDIVNAELIESTLKQTIMCSCFMALEIQAMLRASNIY